jgi:RNA polymerase sigma-70 factor, ECF subfamily
LPEQQSETMELSILLARCRSGDELAWEALVRRFQGRVYGIAYHYTGRAEDAQDVAQEVFIHIYRNLARIVDAEGFLPWLICLCRNASIDHLRRKKARPPASDIDIQEAHGLEAGGLNPEEQWLADSRKRLIYRALQGLSQLSREIILLREIQGLPHADIASMLQVPLGTIKSRANRARLELAQKVLELSHGRLDGSKTGANLP